MSIQDVVPNLSLRNRAVMETRARRLRLNGTIASTELDIVPQYRVDRDLIKRLHCESEHEKKLLRDARLKRATELRASFHAELSEWIAEAGCEPPLPTLPRSTVVEIVKVVADFYNINPLDVISSRKNASLARQRMVVMYLAKKHTACSLAMIGERIKRDHTSVLHGIRVIEKLLNEGNKQIADDIAAIKQRLGVE